MGYGLLENTKIIKSKDVVFLENQILDFKKGKEPLSFSDELIDLNPIYPLVVYGDEGDVEVEHGVNVGGAP